MNRHTDTEHTEQCTSSHPVRLLRTQIEQAFPSHKNHQPTLPATSNTVAPAIIPASAPAPAVSVLEAMFAHTLSGDDEGGFIGLGGGGAGSAVDGYGGRDDEEQGSFLASLAEPTGALMSAGGGGWSISTLPGEEGLRWNGVKTEEVFDEWASSGGGRQQARISDMLLQPSPLLTTAVAAASGGKGDGGSSNLKLVAGLAKSDTEEGWKDFVGPPPPTSMALPICPGKASSDTNSRPHFSKTADKGVSGVQSFLNFVSHTPSRTTVTREKQETGTRKQSQQAGVVFTIETSS